jgi:hypothetical protein
VFTRFGAQPSANWGVPGLVAVVGSARELNGHAGLAR